MLTHTDRKIIGLKAQLRRHKRRLQLARIHGLSTLAKGKWKKEKPQLKFNWEAVPAPRPWRPVVDILTPPPPTPRPYRQVQAGQVILTRHEREQRPALLGRTGYDPTYPDGPPTPERGQEA